MSSSNLKSAPNSTDPYDSEKLKSVVNDLLQEATAQGASAAEAGLSVESGLSVTVRMGEVETIEHNRDKGLGITVYFGHRKGSASTSDFSLKAIKETVKAACDIARYTEDDPFSGLPDKNTNRYSRFGFIPFLGNKYG